MSTTKCNTPTEITLIGLLIAVWLASNQEAWLKPMHKCIGMAESAFYDTHILYINGIRVYFLLLCDLMDSESKVNGFPLTTEDALAFTIRHHLQSILQTEPTASIMEGDTHKTTGTPGR